LYNLTYYDGTSGLRERLSFTGFVELLCEVHKWQLCLLCRIRCIRIVSMECFGRFRILEISAMLDEALPTGIAV